MAMTVKKLPSRQDVSGGGQVQGPSHEQGGVPAIDQGGEQQAEVEGGERVFSNEDTAQIEQACQQIIQLQQQNPKAADQLAKELGYAICEMIVKQEQNEQATQQGVAPEQQEQQGQADAANSFSTGE